MSREAMQMALGALESDPISHAGLVSRKQAITALRQALVDADDTSQKRVDEMVKTEHDRAVELGKAYERGWNAALAQQEPVAWISERENLLSWDKFYDHMKPLYTSPPKREWVGLTLNEAEDFYEKYTDRAELINAIDKFLEEKNT